MKIILFFLRDCFFSQSVENYCPKGFTDIDPENVAEEITGNCVKILPPSTHYDATSECKKHGGHLARPVSAKHNRLIALQGSSEILPTSRKFIRPLWIGYSDVNREGVYVDWEGNRPNITFWGVNRKGFVQPGLSKKWFYLN